MVKPTNKFDTPVLFIIFRRENPALQVIKAISKIRPAKLYISQDGPRNRREANQIKKTREAVLSKITWKCDLTVWTHDKNLGLKKHIPEAFDKFFEKEECGIYLEDDTLPSKEFFYFEQELLDKYKNDRKIFSINGTNFYPELVEPKSSYYLSKIGDIWGFGLWRRSWRLYDPEMRDFGTVSKKKEYKRFFFNHKHRFYLESFWKAIKSGKSNSWAMQMIYAALKNDMYFIAPSVNMVNNIGTNVKGSNVSLQTYHKRFADPFPLKHPRKPVYYDVLDQKYFSQMLKGGWLRLIMIKAYLSLPDSLKLAIGQFVNRI